MIIQQLETSASKFIVVLVITLSNKHKFKKKDTVILKNLDVSCVCLMFILAHKIIYFGGVHYFKGNLFLKENLKFMHGWFFVFCFFFFPKPQSPWKIKCQFIITEFLYINSSRSLLYPDPYFLSLSLVAGFSSLLLLSGKKQPEGLSFWTPMTWDFNNDVTQLHLSTSILTQFWLLLILLA